MGALEVAALHRLLHVVDELFPVLGHLKSSIWSEAQYQASYVCESLLTLIQWVVGVWLQEEVLKADHYGVEVENRFPVLSQDVQAHISL